MKHFPTLLESLVNLISAWVVDDEAGPVNWFSAKMTLIAEVVNFYAQPLALHMFIPCGEDGEPLTKPDYDITLTNPQTTRRRQEWEAAQERMLFEGWEIVEEVNDGEYVLKLTTGTRLIAIPGNRFPKTIDKFLNNYGTDVTPTQSAIKTLTLEG